MRTHFLYDEKENRLILVDGIYPSLVAEKFDRLVTQTSDQPRIYHSVYVWENVVLKGHGTTEGLNYTVYAIQENRSERLIMELPYNDTVIILGGAYEYVKPKIINYAGV